MATRRAYLASGLGAVALGLSGCLDALDDDDAAADTDDRLPVWNWVGESMLREEFELLSVSAAAMIEIPEFDEEGADEEMFGTALRDWELVMFIHEPVSLFGVQDIFWVFEGDPVVDEAILWTEDSFQVTLEETDSYAGYDVYEAIDDEVEPSNEDELFLAFGDDRLVFSNHRTQFETGIDVNQGDQQPLVDEQERLDIVADIIGDPIAGVVRCDEALDEAAVGMAGHFAEDESDLTYGVVAPSADEADAIEADVVDTIERDEITVEEATVSDRAIEVAATADTQVIVDENPDEDAVDDLVDFLLED